MHNPVFVLENETHKLLWDFEIQTDYLISVRRPDLIIINKKEEKKEKEKKENLQYCGLCCPSGAQSKIEKSEKKEKYLDLARELKKHDGAWQWRWC